MPGSVGEPGIVELILQRVPAGVGGAYLADPFVERIRGVPRVDPGCC